MIINIRRWLKTGGFQILLWIILFIMALVFLLPSTPQLSRKASQWIATVNGTELMSDMLDRKTAAIEEQISQARRQWGEYAETLFKLMGMKLDPKVLAYERIVQEALMNQVIQKLNIHMNQEYMQEKLSDPMFLQTVSDLIPMYVLEPGGINEHALNVHLQRSGLTMNEFNQELRNALERDLLNDLIAGAGYIPSFEIKGQVIDQFAPKKFTVLSIPLDAFIKEEKKKEISTEDLKQFFDRKNAREKKYVIPERRAGQIWQFEPRDYNIKVSKEDVEEYYNIHKVRQFADKPAEVQVRRILFTVDDPSQESAVMEKAQSARQELLKNPEEFAQKAKELSQDSKTAKDGGLMPFFSRGTHEEAFEKPALLLREDGDISAVIKTKDGVEILQRVSKKTQTFKSLSQVEKDIRAKLEQRAFKEEFLQDMKELLEEGEVDQDALKGFIQKRGGKAEPVGPMAKDQSKVAQKLFRLSKNGLSFYTDGTKGVAVQLTDIQEKHIPALETIKNNVEEDLYRERATKRLEKQLKDLRKKASTESLQDLAKQVGGSIKTTDLIEKSDTKKLDELRNKGLPVEVMLKLEKVGAISSKQEENDGYIIRLDEIKALPANTLEEKTKEVKAELTKEQLRMLMSGFVASLYRNAIIKTSESLHLSTEDNAV